MHLAEGVVVYWLNFQYPNGSGLDLERAGTDVFKLYKRFHPQHLGRGIGLYLVKSHIDSMGGRITVRSQVDAGTSFTLVFP